jgi:hypothetical protein
MLAESLAELVRMAARLEEAAHTKG